MCDFNICMGRLTCKRVNHEILESDLFSNWFLLLLLISAATIESLMKAMQQVSKRQIMLFDELKTWLASLGLYKAGGNSDYDTSLYLSFYNGTTVKRQTCKGTNLWNVITCQKCSTSNARSTMNEWLRYQMKVELHVTQAKCNF